MKPAAAALVAIALSASAAADALAFTTERELAQQRQQMVESQIKRRGVRDERVLQAMRKVPRHFFVPDTFRGAAYLDQPLPIGEEQTISQPYIVALMTELADIQEGEKVLEIGTGSGYQAAVLLQMTPKVWSIEINPTVADFGAKNLRRTGNGKVKLAVADGYNGWPDMAPFDAILVTAAAPEIPQPLVDQLAENGVLVIPVGSAGGVQTLQRLRKKNGTLQVEDSKMVSFVPLIRKRSGVQ